MFEILRFYKEKEDKWYIDPPTRDFSKDDLLIQSSGMLNTLSNGKNCILCVTSPIPFKDSDALRLIGRDEIGAAYVLKNYKGKDIDSEILLKNSVSTIFFNFPKTLYISVKN